MVVRRDDRLTHSMAELQGLSKLRELSLVGIGEAAPEILCQICFLQLNRHTKKLDEIRWHATKILRDVKHMTY